ncbi:MAG: DUF3341 domain-containing protein [Planctomycetota bacterium]|jgi:hypothetical protein
MAEAAARPPIYAYMAEFDDADTLIAATRAGKEQGYNVIECYTPVPLHEISEILGARNRLPRIILIGGIIGALAGFGMQYYASVVAYPFNIGGKPLNSWPSFIVITFELTVLFAGLAAVFGMLALNGLPRPHHPVFSVEGFGDASRDKFFLLVGWIDPLFDMDDTKKFMEGLKPNRVVEVPHE